MTSSLLLCFEWWWILEIHVYIHLWLASCYYANTEQTRMFQRVHASPCPQCRKPPTDTRVGRPVAGMGGSSIWYLVQWIHEGSLLHHEYPEFDPISIILRNAFFNETFHFEVIVESHSPVRNNTESSPVTLHSASPSTTPPVILHNCSTISQPRNWHWCHPTTLIRSHQFYVHSCVCVCVFNSMQFYYM